MTKTASFKQMRARNLGHIAALRKLAAGETLLGLTAHPSALRGMRTMLHTLHNWGCVETVREGSGYTTVVTDRGNEFLTWLDNESVPS